MIYNAVAWNPLGKPLQIRLVSGGPQVDFDKVSLTYLPIPVPASALLLATASWDLASWAGGAREANTIHSHFS